MHVTHFNKAQADDFLRKYLQKNIEVLDLSYDSEDNQFYVWLRSGKLFRKVNTDWQFRLNNDISSALFGHVHVGLCFGSYTMPGYDKRFDIYECSPELLEKANKIVYKEVQDWLKASPI